MSVYFVPFPKYLVGSNPVVKSATEKAATSRNDIIVFGDRCLAYIQKKCLIFEKIDLHFLERNIKSPGELYNLKLYVIGHGGGGNDFIFCPTKSGEGRAITLLVLAYRLISFFDLSIFREIKFLTCRGTESGLRRPDRHYYLNDTEYAIATKLCTGSIAENLARILLVRYSISIPVIGYSGEIFPFLKGSSPDIERYSDRSSHSYRIGTIPEGEPLKRVYGYKFPKVRADNPFAELTGHSHVESGVCNQYGCREFIFGDTYCAICGIQYCWKHIFVRDIPTIGESLVCINCIRRYDTIETIWHRDHE